MKVTFRPPAAPGGCRIEIEHPLPHVPDALFVALDGRAQPFWADGPYAREFTNWTGRFGYSAHVMAAVRGFVAGDLDHDAAAAAIAQALRQWLRLDPASPPP